MKTSLFSNLPQQKHEFNIITPTKMTDFIKENKYYSLSQPKLPIKSSFRSWIKYFSLPIEHPNPSYINTQNTSSINNEINNMKLAFFMKNINNQTQRIKTETINTTSENMLNSPYISKDLKAKYTSLYLDTINSFKIANETQKHILHNYFRSHQRNFKNDKINYKKKELMDILTNGQGELGLIENNSVVTKRINEMTKRNNCKNIIVNKIYDAQMSFEKVWNEENSNSKKESVYSMDKRKYLNKKPKIKKWSYVPVNCLKNSNTFGKGHDDSVDNWNDFIRTWGINNGHNNVTVENYRLNNINNSKIGKSLI